MSLFSRNLQQKWASGDSPGEVKAPDWSPTNCACADKGMGAMWLTWFSTGPYHFKRLHCQALTGNNVLQQHHSSSMGSLGTVLGSCLPMVPHILGQIHTAQERHLEGKCEKGERWCQPNEGRRGKYVTWRKSVGLIVCPWSLEESCRSAGMWTTAPWDCFFR